MVGLAPKRQQTENRSAELFVYWFLQLGDNGTGVAIGVLAVVGVCGVNWVVGACLAVVGVCSVAGVGSVSCSVTVVLLVGVTVVVDVDVGGVGGGVGGRRLVVAVIGVCGVTVVVTVVVAVIFVERYGVTVTMTVVVTIVVDVDLGLSDVVGGAVAGGASIGVIERTSKRCWVAPGHVWQVGRTSCRARAASGRAVSRSDTCAWYH